MQRNCLQLCMADWEFGGFASSLCVSVCAFELIQAYGYAFKVKMIVSESRTLFSCFTDLGWKQQGILLKQLSQTQEGSQHPINSAPSPVGVSRSISCAWEDFSPMAANKHPKNLRHKLVTICKAPGFSSHFGPVFPPCASFITSTGSTRASLSPLEVGEWER